MKTTQSTRTKKTTIATLEGLAGHFAMITYEEIMALTDFGLKVLAIRRMWPYSRYRTRSLTAQDVISILKCSRTSAYDGLLETAGLPVKMVSATADEMRDSSARADGIREAIVRQGGQIDAEPRDSAGESRAEERVNSNSSSIEERPEKKKSALRLPLPDFFSRLAARRGELTDPIHAAIVATLAQDPEKGCTEKQRTQITSAWASLTTVSAAQKKAAEIIYGSYDAQRDRESTYEFSLKSYRKGLGSLDDVLSAAAELGIPESQAREAAAKAKERGA